MCGRLKPTWFMGRPTGLEILLKIKVKNYVYLGS